MRENRREQVKSKRRICFVSKHKRKIENSHLPKLSILSSVNKPTSVESDPVRLL